jgi:ribosomal protein S18 acetylase RimI-like enzyme
MILRPLTLEDQPIVWQMLMYAAHEPTLTSVKNQPCLSRYAAGWGRAGDMGVIALEDQQAMGAAWLRLWPAEDKGFGYVDNSVPELAIAVLPAYRGQGIGTQLLKSVLAVAPAVYPAVSLSVRDDNPAIRLYQRVGFVKVEQSEVSNRTGGASFTMICDLNHINNSQTLPA